MALNRENKAKKNTVRSKKRRASPRKKKPKVLLNSKYVCILCAGIVCFCALLLAVTFLLTGFDDGTSAKDVAEVAQVSPAVSGGAEVPGVPSVPGGDVSALAVPKKTEGGKALANQAEGGGGKESKKPLEAENSARSANGNPSIQGQGQGGKDAPLKEDSSARAKSAAGRAESAVAQSSAPQKQGGEVASVNQKAGSGAEPVLEAKPQFRIPAAQNGARLAFVIDDGGMSVANVKKYTALPFPLTVAVLPGLLHTAECAAVVRRDGKELMLHQPMQAKNLGIKPGPGAITPDMDSYGIAQTIEKNLAELGPGVRGFNNHEGSLITEDKLKMTFIIDLALQKGLYFLDSRTTSLSQARQAALELDAHIIERNAPFLDNAVTRAEMLEEIYKGLEVANRTGFAVIIGHVDKSAEVLPKLLEQMYPELAAKGYVFTTPSQL